MVINPPNAISILRRYHQLAAAGTPTEGLILNLDLQFREHLGAVTYEAFLTFWHFHLQSIPIDIAQAAWGLSAKA